MNKILLNLGITLIAISCGWLFLMVITGTPERHGRFSVITNYPTPDLWIALGLGILGYALIRKNR